MFVGLFHFVSGIYCICFWLSFCNTLLPNERVQATPADIVEVIKPIPVFDKVIEVGVAPIITIESIDSNIVSRVL